MWCWWAIPRDPLTTPHGSTSVTPRGAIFIRYPALAPLGYALPAALGARCATDSPVVALIGDGGVQFTLAELSTGAQAGLAVPVIVWNNNGYGEIENSMLARNVPATHARVTPPDFAAAAAAHHCGYANPASLAELHSALEAAVNAAAPTLIEVRERDFLTTPSGQWYA